MFQPSERRESTPDDLKWLHKLEVIQCDVDGEVINYEVEDFGEYYDGDDYVLQDIDEFLNSHSPSNLDVKHFILNDVLHPIEFTLRCAIRDIAKDEQINKLRRKKAIFIFNEVLPRIYHHPNFADADAIITRAVTGLLILIVELYSIHEKGTGEDLEQLSTYFKAKDFLASIALHIWSICLYEKGIPMVDDRTIPYMRQLAILDILDVLWNYAGGWGQILALLEERHGDIQRISADKALHEATDALRAARNSIRCQALELGSLLQDGESAARNAPQTYQYFPKCSAYLCQEMETSDKPHRLRCYRCHYYHWCSAACQEYSEEVAGHHDLFCTACPDHKKTEIRSQMQEYLNIAPITDEDCDIKCHACGLLKTFSNGRRMNRCSKCKAVHYCSKACQIWDWTRGQHRNVCEPPIFNSPNDRASTKTTVKMDQSKSSF